MRRCIVVAKRSGLQCIAWNMQGESTMPREIGSRNHSCCENEVGSTRHCDLGLAYFADDCAFGEAEHVGAEGNVVPALGKFSGF